MTYPLSCYTNACTQLQNRHGRFQKSCKVCRNVILSAAKNHRAAVQAPGTIEIFRYAQNDGSCNAMQNCRFAVLAHIFKRAWREKRAVLAGGKGAEFSASSARWADRQSLRKSLSQ